jgi:CBS domain-containing protein
VWGTKTRIRIMTRDFVRTKDVMSSPVVTVTSTMRLKEVATLLVRCGFNAVPVVDEGKLVGIVSEADLVPLETVADRRAHHLPPGPPVWQQGRTQRGEVEPEIPPRTAGEVMAREVRTLPEDADAADAARLMLAHGIKSVPIVCGQRVVGIVSRRDLLKVLARSDQAIAADVERLLAEELGELRPHTRVADGVVTLSGGDPVTQELAGMLASTVPGVLAVRRQAPGGSPPPGRSRGGHSAG